MKNKIVDCIFSRHNETGFFCMFEQNVQIVELRKHNHVKRMGKYSKMSKRGTVF